MPRPVDRQAMYFPGLDGLRVIAVALVIAYHVGVPHVSGGLLGVGVFFTLSGYLITSLLLTSWQRRDSAGLARFWRRRFRRLLPAVVLLLVVVMVATAITRPNKFGEWGLQALAALFYVANWATIAKGDTYFNRFEGPSPLEHLWSLSVEEQFYIFWPLLLLAMMVIFRGRRRSVGIATLLLGLASMIELAVLYSPAVDATRVYEGTDTRAGGLLWGAALALLWHPTKSALIAGGAKIVGLDLLGFAGMAGIIALSCFTSETDAFLYRGGIALLTVATCAVLVAVTHPRTLLARLLGLAPLRWLGERTYGIYLWHMPVAAFLPEHTLYGKTVWRGLIIVGLSVLFAALSWTFVENPIRKGGLAGAWKRDPHRASDGRRRTIPPFVTGSAALAALGAGSLVVLAALPQMSVVEIAKMNAAKDAAHEAKPKSEGAVPAVAYPQPGKPAATSCKAVAHIGDSTSLGLSDSAATELTNPSDRLRARYQAVGVSTVVEDIKGARAIFEHFQQDKNGEEAVKAQQAAGFKGCYVIALGMNDAATISLGGTAVNADQRIDMVMRAAKGQPVMWVNTITQAWATLRGYQNANMQKFNEALLAATTRWPNLRVYDWSADSLPHPEWFMTNDANHNNVEGAKQKASRIAQALAVAYPKGSEPVRSKVVRTAR